MGEKIYAAIDLKSFYASVECVERELDPLTTNLVVADKSRTEKTICLAVSPSLKSYGCSGRPRLFEVVQQTKKINAERRRRAPGGKFKGRSYDDNALHHDPSLELDYIVATPRMSLYLKRSTEVYEIYLRHVAPEDIHVYSIDEVFIDITGYLRTSGLNARSFTMMLVREVLDETGITATAGIGENMYLAKVAMDIVAKKAKPDVMGVRMAFLDTMGYRRLLWTHQPITDFWRVGHGYERRLNTHGMYTMGDIARASVAKEDQTPNEDTLYALFGVNAELLIDHAWGWEPTTIADIKRYAPQRKSVSQGQVLTRAYGYEEARLVMREMADLLSFELVEKGLVCDQLVISVGYDIENLTDPQRAAAYTGEVSIDPYGRTMPKHAHGTIHLQETTSSSQRIIQAAISLFDAKVDPSLLVRRLNITAGNVIPEKIAAQMRAQEGEQLRLFTDAGQTDDGRPGNGKGQEHEKDMQETIVALRHRYGKNAVLKGMDLKEGATTMQRNQQIGGHRA